MTIFINDLFDFVWFDAMTGDVLDIIIFIPLRFQFPELHNSS
jgi:hypothetical protein